MHIIFPPRPKGKIIPGELKNYQNSGDWLAQRKFRGSRAVIHISPDRKVTLGNRHGKSFSRFDLDKSHKEEFLSGLNLKPNTEYWLDGELMNKDQNSTFEVILFDVLHIGKYLFRNPTQTERLNLLEEICNFPKNLCSSGIALEVTKRIWMAQTFFSDFVNLFNEALPIPQLEGLVLRKKKAGLDNTGFSYYETTNLIRCRKQFGCDTPKEGRSGGYQF
jgi:ATP-dependent DNA ligase